MNITESASHYDDLETYSTHALLVAINEQDQRVAVCVQETIPAQIALVDAIVSRMQRGGRLFYMGAGTSGRLAVLDAAECPPTFGTDPNVVVGLIAGGELALSRAVELAEDNAERGIADLEAYHITAEDTVIGISASGGAAYVIAGVNHAKSQGALTAAITCNPETALATVVEHPLICVVGPEVVTGSTRMKAGTATKLILNMLSTTIMIKLGHVRGNQMIDMQLNNQKLHDRALRMIMQGLAVNEQQAADLLKQHGSVRAVLNQSC